jgi:tetratricopeptide (TPR) repeat protein
MRKLSVQQLECCLRGALVTFCYIGHLFGFALNVHAQHPIDIQRASAAGEHFQAIVFAEKMPKRVATYDSSIALAKSAWALGLNQRAFEEFDRILRSYKLDPEEKARIQVSKAILVFQEGRYQEAALHAEQALREIGQVETLQTLSSKAHFVLGESFSKQDALGRAEEHFGLALDGAIEAERPQIHYSLGALQLKLGKFDAAKSHFEQIPVNHELTPRAIRGLAEVHLELGRPEAVTFWLNKARKEYPDNFLDSWVDYALMRSAIQRGQEEEVQSLREQVANRLPPSDPWVVLLNAAAEAHAWSRRQKE